MQSHNSPVQQSDENTNLNWVNQFEELLEYKKQYGHCNVPSTHENETLFQWINHQRFQFKHSKLSEERINMLNTVGFSWGVSNASTWNDKFEQLKLYKSKHGDCNVPVKYDENQPLSNWVRTQRSYFKYSNLSQERMNMLNTIGFNWCVSTTYQDSNNKIWTDKFEELKLYKSKYGHCNVPTLYDKNQQLANWVHIQRFQFKDSKLSQERIDMLNTIGFSWTEAKRIGRPRQLKNHEQIAIETSYQDSKETETTNKEKGETSLFKRSLQDRVQVLCTISIMFQEQKDAIHADMKKRKLDNSA